MLHAAKISLSKAKKNIFLFAVLNCLCYIIFMMAVKYTGLLHITGLRTVNYVILLFMCIFQIRGLVKKFNGFIPFLEVMCISFFTGTASFFLFSIFLFFYSFSDPYLNSLFIMDMGDMPRLVPPLLAFFEGSGISIIIGLIVMEYAARFLKKEVHP
jgi:hypothetical protein